MDERQIEADTVVEAIVVRDGRLQAQKVGREWRFNREGLDQLLAPSVMVAARADQLTPRDRAAVQKRLSRNRNNEYAL